MWAKPKLRAKKEKLSDSFEGWESQVSTGVARKQQGDQVLRTTVPETGQLVLSLGARRAESYRELWRSLSATSHPGLQQASATQLEETETDLLGSFPRENKHQCL